MKKFPFNAMKYGVVAMAVLVSLGYILGKNFLFKFEKSSIKEWQKNFNEEMRVDRTVYLFPNSVCFQGVNFSPVDPSSGSTVFTASDICTRFSLLGLVTQKAFVFTKLELREPRVENWPYYYARKEKWIEFLKNLPQNEFGLVVREGKIILNPSEKQPQVLSASFQVDIQRSSLEGKLRLIMDPTLKGNGLPSALSQFADGLPIDFNFKGTRRKGEFSLERVYFKAHETSLDLWGESASNQGHWQGYVLKDLPTNAKFEKGTFLYLIETAQKLSLPGWVKEKVARLANVKQYAVDINTDFNIKKDHVEIDRLVMSMNNFPVNLKGDVYFTSHPRLSLFVSTYPVLSNRKEWENVERAELDLRGQWLENKLLSSGSLDLYLIKNISPQLPSKQLAMHFKDLSIGFLPRPMRVTAHLREGSLICYDKAKDRKLLLSGMHAVANVENEQYSFVDFYSPFYGGAIKGRLGVKNAFSSPQITSSMRLKDIDVKQLQESVASSYSFNGRMDGQVVVTNDPNVKLRGKITIREGEINQMASLDLIAQYLGLPSLREMSFSLISSLIAVDPKGLYLDNVRVSADDVHVNGYLKLSREGLLSSRFSIALSKDLMEESPSLKALVKLMRGQEEPYKFDFQLSGPVDSINFSWASNELKDRIQKRIPNFVERQFEEKIEQAIEKNNPLSSNNLP